MKNNKSSDIIILIILVLSMALFMQITLSIINERTLRPASAALAWVPLLGAFIIAAQGRSQQTAELTCSRLELPPGPGGHLSRTGNAYGCVIYFVVGLELACGKLMHLFYVLCFMMLCESKEELKIQSDILKTHDMRDISPSLF